MKMRLKKRKKRAGERNCARPWLPGIAALFVICGLILINSCTGYDPTLYPVYDVLHPSEAVQENPRGFFTVKDGEICNVEWTAPIEDGEYIIIDEAMGQWIGELKQAIKDMK